MASSGRNISPEKGNPFYIAAQFKYDKKLSEEENMALGVRLHAAGTARRLLSNVRTATEYGTGAHSAIMLGYDPETDEVHWMDSDICAADKKEQAFVTAWCSLTR